MWHLEHTQISPVLEIEHLLLPGSFRDVPVDSPVDVNTLENIQIVHSVMTNYSANSALILYLCNIWSMAGIKMTLSQNLPLLFILFISLLVEFPGEN